MNWSTSDQLGWKTSWKMWPLVLCLSPASRDTVWKRSSQTSLQPNINRWDQKTICLFQKQGNNNHNSHHHHNNNNSHHHHHHHHSNHIYCIYFPKPAYDSSFSLGRIQGRQAPPRCFTLLKSASLTASDMSSVNCDSPAAWKLTRKLPEIPVILEDFPLPCGFCLTG